MSPPTSHDATLAALRAELDAGDFAAALRLLQAWDLADAVGADLHVAVARAAELAGALDRAVTEYNLALRDDPEHLEALRRLARLRADRGDWVHAARAYRRYLTLAPGDTVMAAELSEVRSLLPGATHVDAPSRWREPGSRSLPRPSDSALRAPPGAPAAGELQAHAGVGSTPRPLATAPVTPDASDPGFGAPAAPGASPWGGARTPSVAPADPAVLAPRDADLVAFVDRFGGRQGVYARQWCSPTGKHGYTPVREPFTPTVARSHLLGAQTVGIYPVRQDGTARFLAFDLDVARYALAQAARSSGGVEPLLRRALSVARSLLDAAASLGLAAYVERSGWKGYHVWLLFEAPVPAAGLRRLGSELLRLAPALPPEVTAEVFPKQSRVRAGGLGNLIKLPLGVHRVTGVRGLFVDPAGRPLPEQLELLRSAPRIGRGTLAGLLRRLAPAGPSPVATRGEAAPAPGRSDVAAVIDFPGAAPDDPSADPAELEAPPDSLYGSPRGPERRDAPPPGAHEAAAPGYSPDDDIELLWLLQRCPVLAELVGSVRRDSVVANPARLVLTYTLGHLSQGAQAVNAVLSEALTVDPSAFLVSRLRGNPMSCPKIRSRVPDVAASVPCDCSFEPASGLYPTPLLHLRSLRATRAATEPLALPGLQAERLVSELYRLRGQIERAERLASDLEDRLRSLMRDQGVAELSTSLGILRLTAGPDGPLALVLPPGRRADRPTGSHAAAAQATPDPAPWPREADDDRAVRDGARSPSDPDARPAAHPQGA